MKKTMISLAFAALLILGGGILFVSTMATLHWDFEALSTIQYETNTYVITEDFHNITINSGTADILFLPSYDGSCRVVCDEERDTKYNVAVEDDSLIIKLVSDKSISNYIRNIGINLHTPKLTVYLPKAEYKHLTIQEDTGDIRLPADFHFESMDLSLHTGDVACFASVSEQMKIKTTTGHICAEKVSADMLDLTVSTGNVRLDNVRCNALQTTGSTGDILLKNVIAVDTISIRRSTGDVRFDASDAAAISVETDTGDVTGTLLTDKVFTTHTSTGEVEVPQNTTGGRCEITASTGDIQITIQIL